MMGGRVGGLVLEYLFEVMKLTIWGVVGMITPICEEWGWSGVGVVNWSGGEKSNAHTVGLVGLLYESSAAAVVKGVGGTAERWVFGCVSVLVPCAVKMRFEVEGCCDKYSLVLMGLCRRRICELFPWWLSGCAGCIARAHQ